MAEFYCKKNFTYVPFTDYEWIKNNKNYRKGIYSFESDSLPYCKECGSQLKFIKRGKYLVIDSCLNPECKTHLYSNGSNVVLSAFLPEELFKQRQRKRIEHTVFNKEYLLSQGYSNEEANNKIQNAKNICSNNGKLNTGKSLKEKLINKYGLEEGLLKSRSWNKLCIEYWLSRGYSEEEGRIQISLTQSKRMLNRSQEAKNNHQYITKDYLRSKGMSDNEITLYMREKSSLCKEFWIKRGFSEEEAIINISQLQSTYSNKRDKNICKESSKRCKEYWLKQGYSYDEAVHKVKLEQTTFSKEICISKYGYDDGINIFNERQIKWQKKLHENGNLHVGYSKISQELFWELQKRFQTNEIYFGELNKEYSLRENNKTYIYDYTDITLKKIIEYQGDLYHANPQVFNNDEKPNPFSNLSAEEIWQKDKNKKIVCENNGFDILYIWDSEFKSNKEQTINKCITFLQSNNE